ncbi:MAG: tetratricopeptide repeat protein [Candidatus Obscuribacterales bacterium]
MKVCHVCKNKIKANAKICWVCDTPANLEDFRQCAVCAKAIRKNAQICRFCETGSNKPSKYFVLELQEQVESGLEPEPTQRQAFLDCIKTVLSLTNEQAYSSLSQAQSEKLTVALCKIGQKLNLRSAILRTNSPITTHGDLNKVEALLTTTCREILNLLRLAPAAPAALTSLTEFAKFFIVKTNAGDSCSLVNALCDQVTKLGKVLNVSSTIIEAQVAQASICQLNHDFNGAFAHMTSAIECLEQDKTSDIFALWSLLRSTADVAFRAENYDEAIRLYEKRIALTSQATSPYFGMPHANAAANWHWERVGDLKRLGQSLQARGRYEDAITKYEECLAIHENSIGILGANRDLYLSIGECYVGLKDEFMAEQLLLKSTSVETGVNLGKARLLLAKIYCKQGRFAEMETLATSIQELALQENRKKEKCNNTDIARMLDECARLESNTNAKPRSILCLEFALMIYQNALTTFAYQPKLHKYQSETWVSVASDLALMADLLEQEGRTDNVILMRKQSEFIKESNYQPDKLADLSKQLRCRP